MSEQSDNTKLTAKHIHKSEDKAIIKDNLNKRMEKVIFRYLTKTNQNSQV